MNQVNNGDARGKPRFFVLQRSEDVSGVSGTGVVAEGCVFSNGRVVLQWLTNGLESIAIHDSLKSLEQIHGHGGRTSVMFIGDSPIIPETVSHNESHAPVRALTKPSLLHSRHDPDSWLTSVIKHDQNLI
jgi:hypothetical protein